MIPFSALTDDILFSLTHAARADRLDDWDGETIRDVLGHFVGLAEGVIASLNAVGYTQDARLENGRVRMSERLLMMTVWARIGRKAEHSDKPEELRRLAKLAQGQWDT